MPPPGSRHQRLRRPTPTEWTLDATNSPDNQRPRLFASRRALVGWRSSLPPARAVHSWSGTAIAVWRRIVGLGSCGTGRRTAVGAATISNFTVAANRGQGSTSLPEQARTGSGRRTIVARCRSNQTLRRVPPPLPALTSSTGLRVARARGRRSELLAVGYADVNEPWGAW